MNDEIKENEIIISQQDSDRRLDKYLLKYFNLAPSSFVHKMLRKKRIKLNDKKAEGNELLKEGDRIRFYISPETMQGLMAERGVPESISIALDIIYEDENVLIVNKPAGLLTHPGDNSADDKQEDTLVDRILAYLKATDAYEVSKFSTFTPAVANRLDRNTSGVVVCGKTYKALRALNESIGNAEKTYLAIVCGKLERGGTLRGVHVKDERSNTVRISEAGVVPEMGSETHAKLAVTGYEPVAYSKELGLTLVKVRLYTGKSHQIRAHMASIGHPIAGDPKYGNASANRELRRSFGIEGQLLHARSIVLHDTGALSYLDGREFVAEPGAGFAEVMKCRSTKQGGKNESDNIGSGVCDTAVPADKGHAQGVAADKRQAYHRIHHRRTEHDRADRRDHRSV